MSNLPLTGAFYLFDPASNRFIPYKPDYTQGIPIQDFNVITQEKQKKERAPKPDNQLGVIVPLIRMQPRQSDIAVLASLAQRYPRVNTIAIVSQSQDTRGIEDFGPDADFNNMIRFLQNASVQVLGYIDYDHDSQNKTLDDLKREVDRWREWYPFINGVYLDNVNNDETRICQALTNYAKIDRSFQSVFVNLAVSTNGGVVNKQNDFVDQMKGVDTFIIYEREGYLADGWYASIKKDWMAKYPRSKFAFVVYRVGNDTLACRNFLDKLVGIEKMAGYVIVQASPENDKRKMREWNTISPLTETVLEHLSRLAQTEGIPASKGVTPQSTVVDASGKEGTKAGESPQETPEVIPRGDMRLDRLGVREIYPSAKTGSMRYETSSENYARDVPTAADISRLNMILGRHEPHFQNVEMTGYYFLPAGSDNKRSFLIRQQARLNYDKGFEICNSTGYIGQLLPNGTVSVVKEIQKDVFTNVRGTTQATTKPLSDRWIGMKTVIYNYTIKQRDHKKGESYMSTFVGMEIWIDDNVTDENGNLVVRNDWKPVMHMIDEGGWIAKVKQGKGKKKTKVVDKIITDGGDCVSFMVNNIDIQFKNLSVREISRVSPD